MSTYEGPTRYVVNAVEKFARLKEAAEVYPDALASGFGQDWLRRKPFDPTPGHREYFDCVYAASNMVQAMRLQPGAFILEVGSGPGWLSQILVGLGYRVLGVEPSPSMNVLARSRLADFAAMASVPPDMATFIDSTFEEASLDAYRGRFDAILFHQALHHVIDEELSLSRAFDLLAEGGCLGVCGEGRWHPGDARLEHELDEEMKQYGTLESPFTREYLDHLLAKTGFEDVVFYHCVNGLFPEDQENKTIREVAYPSTLTWNTFLAWKQPNSLRHIPAPHQAPHETSARILVQEARWTEQSVWVSVELHNTGSTFWPAFQVDVLGAVTMSLTQRGETGEREAVNRCGLDRRVYPGETLVVRWRFDVPDFEPADAQVRLIAEGAFWFKDEATITP